MRWLVLVAVIAACSGDQESEGLPPPERLDTDVVAMAVGGETLYWITDRDGTAELKARARGETKTVWRALVTPFTVQFLLDAAVDGAVVTEFPTQQPACSRYHWIHPDGTSEDVLASELCNAGVMALVDRALLVWMDASSGIFRFDLEDGAITTWHENAQLSRLLYVTERESYALRDSVPYEDLVRIEANGEIRTLTTSVRAQRFALSPDAIYWTLPGWDGQPTTISRVPRDGSGPATEVLAKQASVEGGLPFDLNSMAWVGDALWAADLTSDAVYRVDDGELVPSPNAYPRVWELASHDGALVMLTSAADNHYNWLFLQKMP